MKRGDSVWVLLPKWEQGWSRTGFGPAVQEWMLGVYRGEQHGKLLVKVGDRVPLVAPSRVRPA